MKKLKRLRWMIGIVAVGTLIVSLLLNWKKVYEENKNIDSDKKVIQLKMWYPWSGKEDIFQSPFLDAVEEFNADQNEIHVEVEGFGREIYREMLPLSIASNDTPDIYYCYTGGYLKNIVYADKILPINEYFDESVYDKIDKNSLSAMTVDNKLYGLSFKENVGVFLVNNELFRKYDLDVPHTWQEFLNVSEEFMECGITPLVCSNEKSKGYTMYLEAINLYTSGIEECTNLLSQDSLENIMNSEGSKRYNQLVKNGILGNKKESRREAEQEFYLSKIPMYYAESDIIGSIIKNNCPLYGKVSIIPFPIDNGFQEELLGGVTETFVISKNTKYPNEAVKAMEKITEKFSHNISKQGAGISTWVNEKEEAKDDLYIQVKEIIKNAEKMPYWEVYLEGKDASEYLNMAAENFLQSAHKR